MGNGVYAGIMKLRYITIVFTAAILLVLAANLKETEAPKYQAADTVSLNMEYARIAEGLAQGKKREDIEKDSGCQILLASDADYESRVMEAVKKGDTLLDYNADGEEAGYPAGKIVFPGARERLGELEKDVQSRMTAMCLLVLLIGYGLIALIYVYFIRPFGRLKQFAADVAKGNLDAPLRMTKGNYFGIFTESFDLMREELKKAKEKEYLANMSKKELAAGLSHDMKTPVAVIKATSELMKAKAEQSGGLNLAEVQEKAGVIGQKADMLGQLTDNMFHATLEELESLAVNPLEVPSTVISHVLDKLRVHEDVRIHSEVPECLVHMDVLRFEQVLDNILNNSDKYAGTGIDITFREQPEGIVVMLRDYGEGVPEDELPLVKEKYYRGSNAKGKEGAGLGLYLAGYFMKHMKGDFDCYNDGGFVVNLFLRKAGLM